MDLSGSGEHQNDVVETVLWLRSHDNISGEVYYHKVTVTVVSQGPDAHGTVPCVYAHIQTIRARRGV